MVDPLVIEVTRTTGATDQLDYGTSCSIDIATVAPKSTSISGRWPTKIIQLSGMGERQMRHESPLTHEVSRVRHARANCERARS